ncbi:putative membrane-associated protein [Saccharomonospora marina XMU15]|uniref:Putative membrane-associated protein n=1 Tax=Saccharomonospora marina XMU15 TaxID=882083 RepID=H5WWB6_9PSEU|nr:DedA family protein [Saccharomonospora marina]EHR49398.1 putative membrane-associated protein [Saccharomonospora marina XMU15]
MEFRHASTAESLDGIAGWAVSLMESLAGPGAAVAVGLDNVFPPVPSELVLPLAGFTAARGTFTLVEALVWTTLGSVVGAVIVYYLGMLLGRDRVRSRLVRVPLVKADDLDRAERWFAKHGTKAVFAGRMVPLVRSFISLPAGIVAMPMWKFLTFTALGSLIWNTALVVSGYLLGANWHVVEQYAAILEKLVILAAVAAIAWFVAKRLRDRPSA